MDKELFEFTCDVFDVLASNDNNIKQQEFWDKYIQDNEPEQDCANNIINIGKFQIIIQKTED